MEASIVPILILIITLMAGLVNLFLAFIVKTIWSEVKGIQTKQTADINRLYDYMRDYQDKFDDQLHEIKTQIVKLGVKLKVSED